MTTPAPPCPPWCAGKHPSEGERHIHVSQYRWMSACGPSLALYQRPGREPTLNFDGIQVDLIGARALAGTMHRLGHDDIAAAITELVELAEPAGGAR